MLGVVFTTSERKVGSRSTGRLAAEVHTVIGEAGLFRNCQDLIAGSVWVLIDGFNELMAHHAITDDYDALRTKRHADYPVNDSNTGDI